MKLVFEELTEKIIGLAIEVHKKLGPGLLEDIYKQCLAYELKKKNINFQLEVNCPIIYKEIQILTGFIIDFLIEDKIIIGLKCIDKIMPVHESQLLTYLKLYNRKIGLLINFNERLLKDGIKRMII